MVCFIQWRDRPRFRKGGADKGTYNASQKVRGHGRVVITKVGPIAVTHVPPYPKEQGRLQITSEKTSKKSFRKISAHLSSPQESAAAWLSAHAFNPWKSVVPLSQLSVGRDRGAKKHLISIQGVVFMFLKLSVILSKPMFFQRELLSPREIPVCQYQLWNSNWMQWHMRTGRLAFSNQTFSAELTQRTEVKASH